MRLSKHDIIVKLGILTNFTGDNYMIQHFNDCYFIMYSTYDREHCGEVLCRGSLKDCCNFIDGAITALRLMKERNNK